jgi:RNA polymerase sigma-70 factor (ECF subfamily)
LEICRHRDLILEAGLKESMEINEGVRDKATRSTAINSDSIAIDELFASCMPGLRRTAERMLRNREDSEDVLQDALLSGFQKIDQFEYRAKFSTWMHTILRNSARNMWRRRRCRPIDSSLILGDREEDDLQSQDEIADVGLNPEEEYRQKESSRIVAQLLQMLPPKYREVVWLFKIQEVNIDEVADRLGIRIGTVKARMHRARFKMAKCLADREISQTARVRAARKLGILSRDPHALSSSPNAPRQVALKRARREHPRSVRGSARERSSCGSRITRKLSAHYSP